MPSRSVLFDLIATAMRVATLPAHLWVQGLFTWNATGARRMCRPRQMWECTNHANVGSWRYGMELHLDWFVQFVVWAAVVDVRILAFTPATYKGRAIGVPDLARRDLLS